MKEKSNVIIIQKIPLYQNITLCIKSKFIIFVKLLTKIILTITTKNTYLTLQIILVSRMFKVIEYCQIS